MQRVTRTLSVDPDLHDALVPAMILLPIVENAYAHGLSKSDCGENFRLTASESADHKQLLGLENGH